jgi:rhodanese-related sulfurtransferase
MIILRMHVFILAALFSLYSWGEVKTKEQVSAEAKAGATHISSKQLAGDVSDGRPLLLLDIRTAAEFQAGHIRGAQWLPRGGIEFSIQELTTDPDARIVLYCRSGGRSALAAASLKGIGYNNVVDLEGGFEDWLETGNTFYNLHGEHRVVSYGAEE